MNHTWSPLMLTVTLLNVFIALNKEYTFCNSLCCWLLSLKKGVKVRTQKYLHGGPNLLSYIYTSVSDVRDFFLCTCFSLPVATDYLCLFVWVKGCTVLYHKPCCSLKQMSKYCCLTQRRSDGDEMMGQKWWSGITKAWCMGQKLCFVGRWHSWGLVHAVYADCISVIFNLIKSELDIKYYITQLL